jgi:hypothetical protein
MDLAGQIVLATRKSKGIEELLLRLGSRRRKHCHYSKEKVKLKRQ